MSQPYPSPVAVKTTKRCKYALPGKKYDCRSIGKYLIGEKGYCAPHYDATWKWLHPLYGTSHEWHIHVNKYTGKADTYPSCRRCGAIQVYEGIAQCLCRGKMPEITLR